MDNKKLQSVFYSTHFKSNVMKKIFYIFTFITAFASCKQKTDLTTNKEMISLGDSVYYNNSYLSDTGAISNPEDFINNSGVISGKAIIPNSNKNSTARTGSSNNKSGSTTASTSSGKTTTAKKKGISKAAKGAIIGGAGGAVVGGVIGKNAKGAIIGGIVGAAGGYIIGRTQDKKDGRY